ncbi:Glycine cleavage T protein (aminomethyl transferase) [Methylophilales bacterium HTCC2181]|uniref:Glycine cleavage T protein (Aminomethyl transferase) n=1 Tax=Methylophilales bacterium HTCC2181 TaxID=383631 RepID=A0P6B8_9PROT|nr:Glycine cleavage T protein (aminomethyl transferase) [Methylophilales bacterium HTCC2181]
MQTTLSLYPLHKEFSLIEVSGEDASTFLQGQITNDINLVNETTSVYAGLCNPKGRLLAFFHILKLHDSFFLICPQCIAENIAKKLAMYVLRSKVVIAINTTIRLQGFEFAGEGLCDKVGFPENTNTMQSFLREGMHVTRISGINPRYLCLADNSTITTFMTAHKTHVVEKTCECWKQTSITNKIPNIYLETQGKFIPQSLNLDLINAINFKKGCYTGQEIVARTHYLGTVKKRLFRGVWSGDKTLLNLGNEILTNETLVGQVIDYSSDKSESDILFELKVDSVKDHLALHGHSLRLID